MKTRSGTAPLIIEWSATQVRIFDPLTGETKVGPTLAAAPSGRSVVIAIGRRSAFIRAVPVPSVSRDEIAKMVGFKIGPVLPLKAGEYVHGFRLGRESQGHVAVAAAIKTASLRRIYDEAAAAGLEVETVVPLAFGAWLAARSRTMANAAVVEVMGETLSIDLVSGGELRYSRSTALPDTPGEIATEIANTFEVAGIAPAPILALRETPFPADQTSPQSAMEYLADRESVRKLLFSLELPERRQMSASWSRSWVAQRALLAAMVAALFGGYVARQRTEAVARAETMQWRRDGNLRRAKAMRNEAGAESTKVKKAEKVLHQAFEPAQPFTDTIAALGASPNPKFWLSGLTLERGKPMTLRGQALSSDVVAKYVAALSKEPRFREVKVIYANKATLGQKPVVLFAISGHVVGNLPIEPMKETGKEAKS